MKYTILGFQQHKLIENKLTVEDALILRVIKDMYSSVSMEFLEHEGNKYMWINYTYLLEQLPIMGTKRNLMRKIEKYGNELLILRLLKHERKGQKGNYSYICPTRKLDELQDFDLMTESHKGYDRNGIRVMTKSHNKDSSIKDSSVKDNIYNSVFDHYVSKGIIKHKNLTSDMVRAIDKSEKELGLDLDYFKRIIDRHKERIELTKNNEKPIKARTLVELFGQKKYNSVSLICTDYLDETYKRENQKSEMKAADF